MSSSFVHLHLHTEYSLIDGLVRIGPLINAVAAANMPAVAVTDEQNLFCLVRFYKAAVRAGVKPIAGSELLIRNPNDPDKPDRLILLAQNLTGYRHLTELISTAYLKRSDHRAPQLEREWLTSAAEGLIALSAGTAGDVGRALLGDHLAAAEDLLDDWLRLFGDRYYLELTRTGQDDEARYLERAVDLAVRKGVPVVATNNVRFLAAADYDAHEVRVCIHEGATLADPRRVKRYTTEQYLRTPDEMAELFADLPAALDNAAEIAKRCNLELSLGQTHLPRFSVPAGMTPDHFFAEQSRRGLVQRLTQVDAALHADYQARLQLELDVIIQMGFPSYFLIVADFIQWAKDQGIPVGPGRGSGAGSLVAYALRITDLDPIAHELLFERFLNPERVSMPDFDIDFCMDGRDRVIDYVATKYGREAVSQIITFGTMAAKAVVRDVGRVLGHPYGFVDKIAKMVPNELKMTLDKALLESEELKTAYAQDEAVTALLDMARKLEGLARNAGKHAGGVVIAPTKLTDFAPLYCEPGGTNLLTQFDKDDVEQAGLIKFDFLGLRTLTIIDWAVKTINHQRAQHQEPLLDISRLEPHDAKAFALLKRCETTAVFQLESSGMKELIKKLQPDSFEDITALVALFRPGPLQSGMVDDFIARKHGQAQVVYPHPDLEPILKPTYGIILYQEQVMQIAQVLSGYSLGGADILRRAIGKKKSEEMAQQRAIFEQGAVQRGVEAATARHIFDLIDKFAGYGFNKSHSAAYALVSYQTLWLKAHYPAAFMAAVLSADMDNTDKVVLLIDECRTMQLAVEPPQINHSQLRFTATDVGTIRYGLGAVKGVGESAIEALLQARDSGKPFTDLWDLCLRVDLRRANRRTLEALIRAGALDGLAANRATLLNQLPAAVKLAEQHQTRAVSGQNELFGAVAEPAVSQAPDPQIAAQVWPEWDEDERLAGEKDTLGLYLTGHPINRYESEINAIGSVRINKLLLTAKGATASNGESRTIVGLVVGTRTSKTSRGRMATLTLDDRTGRIEVTVFAELYDQVRTLVTSDQILIVTGTLSFDSFRDRWALRAQRIRSLTEARTELADHLALTLDVRDPAHYATGKQRIDELVTVLQPFRGTGLRLRIHYRCPGVQAQLQAGKQWRVTPSDDLLKTLRQLLGAEQVRVSYRAGR